MQRTQVRQLSRGAAIAAGFVSIVVLFGWLFRLTALKSLQPGLATMKPTTALLFMLCAAELLSVTGSQGTNTKSRRSLLPLIVIGMAALILFEWMSSISVGIDTLLFRSEVLKESIAYPGRMSPATAFAFLALGSGLIFHRLGCALYSQCFSLMPIAIGFFAFTCYLFDVAQLYQTFAFTTVAGHTAILMVLLGTAVLLLEPDRGIAEVLCSAEAGGWFARRIVPFTILLPLVAGWMRLQGQRFGWYGLEFGLALYCTALVTCLVTLLMVSARSLNELHRRKHHSDAHAAFLAALVNSSSDAIIGKRRDGAITSWNEGARQTFGYTADEMVGRTLSGILASDAQVLNEAAIEMARSGVSPAPLECEATNKDGRHIAVSLRISPVIDAAGCVTGISTIARDVTDQKRTEATLIQSQRMQALGTLAGGVAHDINNLLTAIVGNLQLSRIRLPRDHEIQPLLGNIDAACVRAAGIVRQILTFSRGQTPERLPTNIQSIFDEGLTLLTFAASRHIDICREFSSAKAQACVDPTQLMQVVMNLGMNAIHALGSDANGQIRVQTEVVHVTKATAVQSPTLSLPAGNYVHIRFSDNGCGIPPEVLTHIFEPFFTTKGPGEGTGLGLSVVHGIVHANGGQITVQSVPGEGTTFDLYFPETEPQPASEPIASVVKPVSGRSKRILYIDDEQELAAVVKALLETLGYEVTCCSEPSEAMALVRERSSDFDAIITDLAMPGISGLDIAREIRNISAQIPVAFMSGFIRPEDRDSAEKLGVKVVIQKPAPLPELARSVQSLVDAAETH